jgi:hypothetical protein
MASRQREFYSRAYGQARAAGLPDAQARLAASQAALETNFGQNSVGNNYFGIKAGSSWNGPSVTAGTWEDYGNGPVRERAAFRSYEDPTDSFRDWQSTLGKRWGGALAAPTLSDAVEGLNYGRPGGYATDRNYGSKIRSIDARYGPSSMEVGFDAPTPTSRPPDLEGILSASEPVSPQEYAAYSSPLTSVQRAPLKDVNMRLQQPTMQTVPELSYGRFATTPFDEARFAAAPGATGKNALRRGLLDQQLDAGILPSLDNPAYAAMAQPDYVDPTVTSAYAEPASIKTAAVQAPPAFDAQPGLTGGLLSPQEQRAVAAQRAYLDQQPFNKAPSQFGSKAKQAAGSILGAVLGGLTLGPVGALGGGLLGNVVTRPGGLLGSQFPDKPKSQSRGDGSLTDYGRSVANQSSQFSRAMASGGKGLY